MNKITTTKCTGIVEGQAEAFLKGLVMRVSSDRYNGRRCGVGSDSAGYEL